MNYLKNDYILTTREDLIYLLGKYELIRDYENPARKNNETNLLVEDFLATRRENKKKSFIYRLFKSDQINWKERVKLFERLLILKAIRDSKGHGAGTNKSQAAKDLDISREALRRKLMNTREIAERIEGVIR